MSSSRFIETNKGLFNSDCISRIWRTYNKKEKTHTVHCEMREGGSYQEGVELPGVFSLEMLSKEFVKADPGFYVLEPYSEESSGKFTYTKHRVVAWAVDWTGGYAPQAVILADTITETYIVLTPEGMVYDQGNSSYWDNLEEWVSVKQLEKENAK